MNSDSSKPKANLLVELAKRKAAAQSAGTQFGVLGKDITGRPSRKLTNQSYTWRGGRNGQGKP